MGISEQGTIPPPTPPNPQVERAADELQKLEEHLAQAASYVRSDRSDVADYLLAVKHGVRLGRLRRRGLAYKVGRNQGIA